jgi:hypothetical protein
MGGRNAPHFFMFKELLIQKTNSNKKVIARFCTYALADPNYPYSSSFIAQLKYLEDQRVPASALLALTDLYKEYIKNERRPSKSP